MLNQSFYKENKYVLFISKIFMNSFQNIFEPGALENEEDVKQYTAEYERIQAKIAEKSAGPIEANIPTTPISPVTALDAISPVDPVQPTIS